MAREVTNEMFRCEWQRVLAGMTVVACLCTSYMFVVNAVGAFVNHEYCWVYHFCFYQVLVYRRMGLFIIAYRFTGMSSLTAEFWISFVCDHHT